MLWLLNFTMPKVFEGKSNDLIQFFSRGGSLGEAETRNRVTILKKAKTIMQPFLLRRKKADVLTDLPAKLQKAELCEMFPAQKKAYVGLLMSLKRQQATNKLPEEPEAASDGAAPGGGGSPGGGEAAAPLEGPRRAAASRKEYGDVSDAAFFRAQATPSEPKKATAPAPAAAPSAAQRRAKAKADAAPAAEAGEVQNTGGLANVLMQARKLANHPLLHRIQYTDARLREMAQAIRREEQYFDASTEYIFEDMGVMTDFELDRLARQFPNTLARFQLGDIHAEILKSGKLARMQALLKERQAGGHRVLIFSQFMMMLDILQVRLGSGWA